MTEENLIIAEIRETRERMLAEHQGDLNRLIDELQRIPARPEGARSDDSTSDSPKVRAKMVS